MIALMWWALIAPRECVTDTECAAYGGNGDPL